MKLINIKNMAHKKRLNKCSLFSLTSYLEPFVSPPYVCEKVNMDEADNDELTFHLVGI